MKCIYRSTELATDEEQAEVQTFYEDLGTLALEKKSVNYTCCMYLYTCTQIPFKEAQLFLKLANCSECLLYL